MSHVYKPYAGEDIGHAAEEMVKLVAEHGEISADFNGIPLRAVAGTTSEDIESSFRATMAAENAKWLGSSEYADQNAKREIELAKKQAACNSLIEQLHSLDFKDDVTILTWLQEFTPLSDDTGVKCNSSLVIETFKQHGFEPSVNIGEKFNGENRDNYFRYIVGQGLACLKSVGAIHQVIHTFIERWNKTFIQEEKQS